MVATLQIYKFIYDFMLFLRTYQFLIVNELFTTNYKCLRL